MVSRRLLLLGSCAAVAGLASGWRAGAAGGDVELNQLIADSGAADRALDPTGKAAFVDPLSDAYAERRLKNKMAEKARLDRIDRAGLSPTGQLAYDVFRYTLDEALNGFSSGTFLISRMTPLDPSFGLQVQFPDAFSSNHENGLERLRGFGGYLRQLIVRLKEGQAKGYIQPKIIVTNVLAQIDLMLGQKIEDTPFYQSADYRQVIETDVLGGFRLLKTYLEQTYLPTAREEPGLWAQKDGAKIYAAALRRHTTTDLGAEEIHSLGLSEVARIRGEMEAARQTIGFQGDLHALFEHIRSDPQFYYTQPQDLLDRFKAIEARVWQGIPRLFNHKPKAPFEVRPLPALGAARGTGYYSLGPPDGVSPGVLYFNMSMLSTRPIPTLETLTLHEGIPGHHFQGTLAEENTDLPDILRFGLHANGGFTAYVEGWGLYAESLGKALGMFTDPYQWFGHLDFEMLRAVRLVVDTGLHAKGWTRDQAIAFMTDNTSMAAKDIRVEIDRYIASPGQATAYKVGELKLQELRKKAEAKLGAAYDIRAFHDQVLMTGAMPLAILEAKIDRWIDARPN